MSEACSACSSDDGSYSEEDTSAGPHGVPEMGREGTIPWYLSRLQHRLCEGSPVTLLQYCYQLLTLKQSSSVTDKFVDQLLRMQAHSMPKPNCYPPSLYIVRRLVVQDSQGTPDKFEYHVCPNECLVYPQCPRSDWEEHYDDECPKCHEPRFSHSPAAPCKPQKRFWYFGVRNMVQMLANNPHWNRLRGQGRNSRPGDYWGSKEFQRLCRATDGAAADRDRSVLLELGLDWFQPFNFRTWSTGLLCMR